MTFSTTTNDDNADRIIHDPLSSPDRQEGQARPGLQLGQGRVSPGGAGVLGEVLSRPQGVPVPDAATLAGVHTAAPQEEPALWAPTP